MDTKKFKIETWLPIFSGFYNTLFEPDEMETIENINQNRSDYGLTELEYDQFDFDYDTYHNDIAKEVTEFIEGKLKEMGLIEKIEFQAVQHPKEYNVFNDTININVVLTEKNKLNIHDYLMANEREFARIVKDENSSRPGFISFHSSDYIDWLNDWDETINNKHKLGFILEFCLENEYTNFVLENEMKEYVVENGITSVPVFNYDEVTYLEYCQNCNKFIDPNDYNGNTCIHCENNPGELKTIRCCECYTIIVNNNEIRHFKLQLNSKTLKPSEVICNDCQLVLA